MSKVLLILGLLSIGQLGDRYPNADDTSTLPRDSSEGVTTSSAVQPDQESAQSESTTAQTELFEDAPQDSGEIARSSDAAAGDTTGPIEPPIATSEATPPATSDAPQTPTVNDPLTLLKSFSEPGTGSQLSGTPVALAEVIASSPTRNEQTQQVEAYWDLSQAVLDYKLAIKEKIELAALRRGIAQAGPHWDKSLKLADSREQFALHTALVAQQRLAKMLSLASEDPAPLPSDLPFVGTYNTRYEELFSQRDGSFQGQTPRIAKEYDLFLTSVAQIIENEAEGIGDAREWMFAVSEQRNPDTDGRELLSAYELFAARRRLFVSAVGDYNRAIVRYTEIATPGIVEPQRLVAMLIRVDSTVDAAVRRTSAEEQLDSTGSRNSQPRATAENGWHALPNNSERSILVPSR